jgi:hypothetical protein
MLNIDIALYVINIILFILGFIFGKYRTKKDKIDIENTLNLSSRKFSNNLFKILNDFNINIEDLNQKNSNLINENNKKAIRTLNNQIDQLNILNKTLSNMYESLSAQTELYQRINMLQKIIVKKKKKELDKV